MPKTPSCCRFASRKRFDGFWLGAEPFFIRTPPRGKAPGGDLPSPIFCRTSAAPLHFCRKGWLGAVLVVLAVSTCIRRALCPRFHARASVRDPARQGASSERRQKHGLGDSFGCAGSAGLILIGALQRFRSCAAQRGKSLRRTAFLRSTRSARFRISVPGLQGGLGPASGTAYF